MSLLYQWQLATRRILQRGRYQSLINEFVHVPLRTSQLREEL